MSLRLAVSLGQHSAAGRKPANQDFHGALIPDEPALTLKGIVLALADGLSSSAVGAVASSAAVRSFLTDYMCTSDAWSVKTAAQRVIAATNSWLHAETRRSQYAHDVEKGYVCTFSVLILKGRLGHIFHVGDARIHRLCDRTLEQLTEDHRVVLSSAQSYLGRALGAAPNVEIDYLSIPLEPGDVFVLSTDGVHDHLAPEAIAVTIQAAGAELDRAARDIVAQAEAAGSGDNLTVQIVRIDSLPDPTAAGVFELGADLPPAPLLAPGMVLDGFRIARTLRDSARSHVYLGTEIATGAAVTLKVPSIDLRDDADYRRRFLMEEWVARRIDHPHVLKAHVQAARRTHLYLALAYVEGQTLAQWRRDHPAPALERVRDLVEQIGRGLTAFHRRDMVHRDLRPDNVLVDASGAATIIDFGSTLVAGVAEFAHPAAAEAGMGTAQYTAPECLLGAHASPASDQFSLGILAYQLLTGTFPYGAAAARIGTARQRRALRYRPARQTRRDLPDWVDQALQKAVHPFPQHRFADVGEFLHALRHPDPFLAARRIPLVERDPVRFWKAVALTLALAVAWLAVMRG